MIILATGLAQSSRRRASYRWSCSSAANPRESPTSLWQFPVYKMGAVGGSHAHLEEE